MFVGFFRRCCTVLGLVITVSATADVLPGAPAYKPYTIAQTEVRNIQSSVNQINYELYIRLPDSYEKGKKSYPVIVLNDTNFAFPLASGVVRLMGGRDIQEVILVGISYSLNDSPGTSRTRDYTPTFAPDETSYHSVEAKQVSGRAKDYLKFIEQDVFPFLRANYRIDAQNKVFVGHSFGGLLGSYALITNPGLFDHYVIGSPSLWYDKKAMFSLEQAYAEQHKAMPANVLMYIGEKENNNIHTMVDDLLNYEKQLRSRGYQGLNLSVEVIPGASHHSAFSILLTQALWRLFPKEVATKSAVKS